MNVYKFSFSLPFYLPFYFNFQFHIFDFIFSQFQFYYHGGMIDNGCGCGLESFGQLPQISKEFKLSVKCALGHTYDSPTSPYGPVHELGGSWVVRSKANRSAAVWSFRLGGEMTRISERFAVGKREKRQCFASDVHNVYSQRIHQ